MRGINGPDVIGSRGPKGLKGFAQIGDAGGKGIKGEEGPPGQAGFDAPQKCTYYYNFVVIVILDRHYILRTTCFL